MRPSAMECLVCGTEIRGRFRHGLFQLLDDDEQQLLEDYLLAGFNIKSLAGDSGMGYTAIRGRLDRLIDHYRELRAHETAQTAIIDQVADGKLTAEEAAELIAGAEAEE
ncbi:MAG: DUF2089 family protein [Candidatus Hydrogenedentes bacterium]|nr:DUF2089 family protein [Candidatus Hydrogenedentota bacterium]